MTFVEIYSADRLIDCEQRAFVLKAVGIEHIVGQHEGRYLVLVADHAVAHALEQLRRYDEENRPRPRPPALRLHARAWTGSVLYALICIGVAWLASINAGANDWLGLGALTSGAVRGEWWRTITALMLHADAGHLIANLAFGIPYGFFASQLLGGGRAWFSILIAAALGNLLDSAVMGVEQRSIGASTAVFAMLGLVAAYSWRISSSRFGTLAMRWAPLVAAVALLGLTGTGDERTDVIAHLAGFLSGAAVGTLQGHLNIRWLEGRLAQTLATIAVLALTVGAWLAAFASVA